MDKILEGLNKQQKEAVAHGNGPCLIIAGAGTGKTKVITSRIAYIIAQKWAKPSEILALTFTDKAAQEMEERVDVLVPYGFIDTWISTFNAFGDRIIRDYSIDLGLPANFKILSSTEQAIFMRENLFSFDLKHYRPIANPISHIRELLTHFSRLKDELISENEYLQFAKNKMSQTTDRESMEFLQNEKTLELANAYKKYKELMLENGYLDYGDQIYLVYKLLSERPDVAKQISDKFKFVLVDEFQDTNYAQYEIVKKIARSKNITVVGDDDQSIYRFRGASISNILSFKDDFPQCKQIVLFENYRSTQEILDCSYRLIQHNNPDRLEAKNNISKKLKSTKNGPEPKLLHCQTLSCEADMVADEILKLKKELNLQNKDFAILSRANNHLEPFITSLNHKKIDNVFIGSSSLFQTDEVKMLIAFLKCLVYFEDNLSFYQLATSEMYNIDVEQLTPYYAKIKKENKTFEEIFGLESQNFTTKIIEDLGFYRKMLSSKGTGEILYDYLKRSNYLKKLTQNTSASNESKVQNIAKFFDRISQFDRTSSNSSVLSFLSNLELIMEVGDEVLTSDIDPDIDAVSLMSVHASKGLEWPVVFVVNMVSDRFPSRDRKEKIPIPDEIIRERLPSGDFHIQEERRLFYVAMTRAKDRLYFSSAQDYGGKRAKKISPFVLEALDNPNIDNQKYKLTSIEKIARHSFVKNNNHKKVRKGDGIIRLSRQQIDDYYTCPKKYYYSAVIQIPLPVNWHFMYGSAIHEAIARYYIRKMSGKKHTLEDLIKDFNQCFKSEGFITREHEEQRKNKGEQTLTKFFQKEQKSKTLPYKVEDSFEFFEDGVKIRGRYDLVYKHDHTFTICDFKTSDVTNQKDADTRIKQSTQMKIYALSWFEKYKAIPQTSLIFIESDLHLQITFSKDDLDKTKELIFEVAQGIKNEDYTAKPDIRQCSLCPYKEICKDAKIG
ncbi:MAG: ATP-dependent DNA helicase PcrA [candidate division WS2 bacterium ADurb.Bin280]|uniref:DNA 3'-5' helicase n=1 Tax=candidate division WS2 bacterium ADurb.Bin280 TaxID=1852829 RepID=A0A1V5SG48_9BACT|nr:MAG: ATP-dependent DNA helicase PcrA [candidate division WS2 bacterium ADurb.Bin280]